MTAYSDLAPNGFEICVWDKDGAVDQQGAGFGDRPRSSLAHERVKRLWDMACFVGSMPKSIRALGVGIEALLMVELSKHKRSNVDAFVQVVGDISEAALAFLLTGRWDVVVHVVARDMAHLKDLALDKFTNQPGNTRIETAIVYDAEAAAPALYSGARSNEYRQRDTIAA